MAGPLKPPGRAPRKKEDEQERGEKHQHDRDDLAELSYGVGNRR